MKLLKRIFRRRKKWTDLNRYQRMVLLSIRRA